MATINPTTDQLNEWLSQQTMRGTIGGNRLADLASPQAMNTIRSSSGNVIDLNYAARGGSGIAPDGSRASYDPHVDGPRVLSRMQRQDGTFEVIKEVPAMDGFGRQSSTYVKEIETPAHLNPAELKRLDYMTKLADLQKKQADAMGGVKPQLVDGQWVFPPSQDAPTGRAVPVEGFQTQIKPPSDEQSKASGFLERSVTANSILQTIGSGTPKQGEVGQEGEVQPGLIKRAFGAVPFYGEEASTAMNWTQSAPQQQVEQAQRDFVNAILRRESGAVINPSEFDNAAKQYFPQPGDSRQVIAQKTKNRENAMSALETSAGNSPVIVKKVQGAKAQSQALIDAYAAIRKGADPSAVKARLEQMGVSYHGIKE